MKDIILAAMVADFVFAMQSPELVDRWLWFPFLLALTFRNQPAPEAPAHDHVERTEPLSPAAPAAPEVVGNGRPRRVSGTVGRHAAPSPSSS
jgi:hypothetical protein